jgi:hypothetical protein
MLEMMAKLIAETKENNTLLREHIAKPKNLAREHHKREMEGETEDAFKSPHKSEHNAENNRWDNRQPARG